MIVFNKNMFTPHGGILYGRQTSAREMNSLDLRNVLIRGLYIGPLFCHDLDHDLDLHFDLGHRTVLTRLMTIRRSFSTYVGLRAGCHSVIKHTRLFCFDFGRGYFR